MDFNILNNYFDMLVLVACLVVGYIIKHSSFCKRINNNDIPAILAVVGIVVNALANGPTIENMIYGAMMGLSSTGLHQAFKKYVEKSE